MPLSQLDARTLSVLPMTFRVTLIDYFGTPKAEVRYVKANGRSLLGCYAGLKERYPKSEIVGMERIVG